MNRAARVLLVVAFAIGIMPILEGGRAPSLPTAVPNDLSGGAPSRELSVSGAESPGPYAAVVTGDSLEDRTGMAHSRLPIGRAVNPSDLSDWDKLRILFR